MLGAKEVECIQRHAAASEDGACSFEPSRRELQGIVPPPIVHDLAGNNNDRAPPVIVPVEQNTSIQDSIVGESNELPDKTAPVDLETSDDEDAAVLYVQESSPSLSIVSARDNRTEAYHENINLKAGATVQEYIAELRRLISLQEAIIRESNDLPEQSAPVELQSMDHGSIVEELNELLDTTASGDPKISDDEDQELLYVLEIISPSPDTNRPKTRYQACLDSLVYSEPATDIPSETEGTSVVDASAGVRRPHAPRRPSRSWRGCALHRGRGPGAVLRLRRRRRPCLSGLHLDRLAGCVESYSTIL